MKYTLYNKRLDQMLEHPIVGIWYTPDLKEAEEMLAACKEWLNASGMSELESDFSVIGVETPQ
jgi:hypothetical protein